jgi:hypothetical protein
MYHELILALFGHPGSIFVHSDDNFKVNLAENANPFLTGQVSPGYSFFTPPEEERLNQLLSLGYLYSRLERYMEEVQVSFGSIIPSDFSFQDAYLHCFGLALDDGLQRYREKLIAFEEKVDCCDYVIYNKQISVYPNTSLGFLIQELHEVQ